MTRIWGTRVSCRKRWWGRGVIGSFLLWMVMPGPPIVAAQSVEQFDKVFTFIGGWDPRIRNPDGEDRGNCGGRLGDYGEKLLNCSLPVDQLPLNARAEAWLTFADHRMSPTLAECAIPTVPNIFGGPFYIWAFPDHLTFQYNEGAVGLITRQIWMDGRAHPEARSLFQNGHSIGWWDGNDLMVETTNFTFDPDGIDDHLHMASSVRKKVTERYQIVEEDVLRLIITLEDPTFLTRPFKYAFSLYRSPGGIEPDWTNCDPEVTRNEVIFAYPGVKYPED